MNKPTWKKGDVIAMPTDLCPDGAIYHGCRVFVAEREPVKSDLWGKWYYGFRPCEELRAATIADCDRLIDINLRETLRAVEQLRSIIQLRHILKRQIQERRDANEQTI